MKLKDIIGKLYPFDRPSLEESEKEKLQRAVDEIEERHKTLEALMSKEITREETIQAIRDSIEHWERDILKPLKQGNEIKRVSKDITLQERSIVLHWIPSGEKVKCYSDSCALCKVFYGKLQPCEGCPLYEAGFACVESNSPYTEFYHNPCLDTAQNMVLVLGNLLIDALEEKRRIEKRRIEKSKIDVKKEKPIIIRPGLWYNTKKDVYFVLFKNQEDNNVWEYYCLQWDFDSTYRYRREELEIKIKKETWIYCPNAKIKVIDGK